MRTKEGPIPVERLSRPAAIERIRANMKALTDDEHCACATAARFGVLCGGFRNVSDSELRRRFDWISRSRPNASRQELEQLVSDYHLGRQEVTGASLCCDLETREHCACDGWNMFDNQTLERFCLELTEQPVRIE